MIDFILFAVVLGISYFAGVLGFAQIIGSMQTKQKGFIFTIILWGAILVGVLFGIRYFFPVQIWGCYMGYTISFIIILKSGKIE